MFRTIEHFGKECLERSRHYTCSSLVMLSGIVFWFPATPTPPSCSAEDDSVRKYYAIYLLAVQVKEDISDISKSRMMQGSVPERCPVKLHAFHYLVIHIFVNVEKLFKIKIDLTKGEVLAPTNYSMIIILSQSS